MFRVARKPRKKGPFLTCHCFYLGKGLKKGNGKHIQSLSSTNYHQHYTTTQYTIIMHCFSTHIALWCIFSKCANLQDHTCAGLYYELMESGICSQCKKSLIPPGEESISTSEVRQKGLDQLLSYYVCAFSVFQWLEKYGLRQLKLYSKGLFTSRKDGYKHVTTDVSHYNNTA